MRKAKERTKERRGFLNADTSAEAQDEAEDAESSTGAPSDGINGSA